MSCSSRQLGEPYLWLWHRVNVIKRTRLSIRPRGPAGLPPPRPPLAHLMAQRRPGPALPPPIADPRRAPPPGTRFLLMRPPLAPRRAAPRPDPPPPLRPGARHEVLDQRYAPATRRAPPGRPKQAARVGRGAGLLPLQVVAAQDEIKSKV